MRTATGLLSVPILPIDEVFAAFCSLCHLTDPHWQLFIWNGIPYHQIRAHDGELDYFAVICETLHRLADAPDVAPTESLAVAMVSAELQLFDYSMMVESGFPALGQLLRNFKEEHQEQWWQYLLDVLARPSICWELNVDYEVFDFFRKELRRTMDELKDQRARPTVFLNEMIWLHRQSQQRFQQHLEPAVRSSDPALLPQCLASPPAGSSPAPGPASSPSSPRLACCLFPTRRTSTSSETTTLITPCPAPASVSMPVSSGSL